MTQEPSKSWMLDLNNFTFIDSGCLSAKENMQIDEELISSFKTTDKPILRLYSWHENSCTIGISQNFEDIPQLEKYKNTYAKRMTGGGVLFHGNDISYSLVMPTSMMKGLSVKQSYEKICSFLLEFYKSLGLRAMYAKDDDNIVLSKSNYCQVGFEPYDIVIDGKKIGGNAQRRKKDVIFQHGSIPLFKSENDESYSLEDFGVDVSFERAKNYFKVAGICFGKI